MIPETRPVESYDRLVPLLPPVAVELSSQALHEAPDSTAPPRQGVDAEKRIPDTTHPLPVAACRALT